MAVYRVQRTRDYTVMSNYHLKDKGLTLKSKGLLSMILSLPEEWNYTTRGLASICKEGVDAIGSALKELETAGYIVRRQLRGANGRITDTEYIIYVSGLVLGLISMVIALLGAAVLLTCSLQNGIILLVMAFLISPYGLPMAAIWLLGKVQDLKFAIQDLVYG